jgi:hypothetical protein
MGNKAKSVSVVKAAAAASENVVLAGSTVTAQPAPAQPTVYTVVAPKRPLGTATKHGQGGTAGTHAALAAAAAANGGTLTAAQAVAVCTAQGDKAFFGYAVRKLRVLQPVVSQV